MEKLSTKLVAFDFVGTIVEPRLFERAKARLRVDFVGLWSWADVASGFSTHFDYSTLLAKILEKSSDVLAAAFRDDIVSNAVPSLYPEVGEVLRLLRSKGILLGFVTDGSDDVEGAAISRILHNSGISPRECIVVTAQQVGAPKVTGRPFDELAERSARLGVSREEILFVGDSPENDIQGAGKAGLLALLLVREQAPNGSSGPQPRHISDLRELSGFLE